MDHVRSLGSVGCAVAVLLVSACGSGGTDAAGAPSTPAPTASAGSASVSSVAGSSAAGSSAPGLSAAGSSAAGSAASSTAGSPAGAASPTISIPPYLCQATDIAQNAADAYMGALGAGNEKQASACVLPGTVPAATTHGLLADQSGTAAYLPRDGVDGPAVFGYRGSGKSIDVTVTREPDGRFWVTRVVIGRG